MSVIYNVLGTPLCTLYVVIEFSHLRSVLLSFLFYTVKKKKGQTSFVIHLRSHGQEALEHR